MPPTSLAPTARTLEAPGRSARCDRTSRALAAALGIEPTMFPGGHTGFAEDPAGFAARLRSVLRAS